ncbi:hypothetical protein OS493_038774 [Desmophyllum pertusum]|uniref:Helicase Helix-turn-helix domain-containing protein n=1 Tax=Desmophyllum pertusum TaxID=174260 RepID=A0A9W9Y742_9CNID|nr:hypothetical protein OS493_038774 [Desmophyllum pertusum]
MLEIHPLCHSADEQEEGDERDPAFIERDSQQQKTKSQLMLMYGKNDRSNRKILVAEEFKKGKSLQEIADQIRVAKATAEIYGIDPFAAGIPLDHNQLAAELGIEDHQFHAIKKCIQCNVDFKLKTVKDSLEVYTYNQIRFIIGV